MKRSWRQEYSVDDKIAAECEALTDEGWTVHSIVPLTAEMEEGGQALLIVAWRDEEPGQPGQPFGSPARMP